MKVSTASGATVVSVVGELAADTAPAFGTALDHLSNSTRPVLVDLEGLTRIDGLGLSVLVQAFRRLREHQCALIVVAPPPAVRAVIDESGIEDFMPICRTFEEAAALVIVMRGHVADDQGPTRRLAGPEVNS